MHRRTRPVNLDIPVKFVREAPEGARLNPPAIMPPGRTEAATSKKFRIHRQGNQKGWGTAQQRLTMTAQLNVTLDPIEVPDRPSHVPAELVRDIRWANGDFPVTYDEPYRETAALFNEGVPPLMWTPNIVAGQPGVEHHPTFGKSAGAGVEIEANRCRHRKPDVFAVEPRDPG